VFRRRLCFVPFITDKDSDVSALLEIERQVLRQLTISDAIMDAARLEHVNSKEAKERFGVTMDVDSGLAFPYLPPPNGDPNPTWRSCRIRQDKVGKERKYMCPPGPKKYLYFAPCRPSWITDKSTPVVIVESEKAALAGLRYSSDHNEPFIWIATGGVFCWHGTIGKTVTPDGERVDEKGALRELELCRGRSVYIFFDTNIEKKPALYNTRKKLAKTLLGEFSAQEVFYVNFPDGLPPTINGPDDFLGLRGDREFARLLRHFTVEVHGDVSEDPASLLEIPDMPEGCLDGRLGEICHEQMGDFCRAYAWPALLAVGSAGILDRHESVRTNIYAVPVGPVRTGKTQAIERGKKLLGLGPSSIIEAYTGSGEQFVKLCGDAMGNPRLFAPDEMGHVMEKMQIDRSSLAFIFTRAFGQDRFQVTQSNKAKKEGPAFFDCHLSIAAGIVQDLFENAFGFFSVGGFYDRILFSLCPSGYAYDYRPFEGAPEFYNPKPVIIRPDVWEQISDWRQKDINLGRTLEIGLRAATICAAWDRRPVLTSGDLKPMKHLVDYQKQIRLILQPNIGETLEGKITDKILRHLKSLPEGTGVTRRTLWTQTNMYRLSLTTAERVLKILISNGALSEQQGKRADSSLVCIAQ
jgi:Domain of unknown function (DUF3854)